MDSTIRLLIVILVFCLGFTLGQGHRPLDFNGDGHITGKDWSWCVEHLKKL
jgi:hypothetical protein